jgi:hypothetical protein
VVSIREIYRGNYFLENGFFSLNSSFFSGLTFRGGALMFEDLHENLVFENNIFDGNNKFIKCSSQIIYIFLKE